jgi:hypothetical protein
MHLAMLLASLGIVSAPLTLFAMAVAPNPPYSGGGRWGDLEITPPNTAGSLSVYLLLADAESAAKTREILTLEEALDGGAARVHETSNVNQLLVENLGRRDVFIQMGDIIKGGKQDRMFTTDLLLPPNSGKVEAWVNCVEQGRWSRRGSESVEQFASSEIMVPARAMRMPAAAPRSASDNQSSVWGAVARLQERLELAVAGPLRAESSPSSLELTLENDRLRDAMASMESAFSERAHSEPRAVGYAYAVGGELYGAEVYASHDLLAKLWPKLVHAMAVEAVAAGEAEGVAPTPNDAAKLLRDADAAHGQVVEAEAGRARLRRVDSARYVASETKDSATEVLVHKMVLAKD